LPYAVQLYECHEIGQDTSDLQNPARRNIPESLIWKEAGESCLFGLKEHNGCHGNMAKFISDNVGMS
jgi:hypothetical protein